MPNVILLGLLLTLALLCTYLRRKAVRWLFTLLMVIFWILFLGALGYRVGYLAGLHGFHAAHVFF